MTSEREKPRLNWEPWTLVAFCSIEILWPFIALGVMLLWR